jgi:ABC-type thiamin/hydroxymethylpyrimidine transport system permease subunit
MSSSVVSTKDIVTIAVLASLGGALSTFVGYLGNLINLALGVPFGAGQFMAGLHVFWLVLIRVIVPKRGVGTAGGLLKGIIEMFTGSTHGIVIVIVSLVQGIIIDIGASAAGTSDNLNGNSRFTWWTGAGLSSAANVIVLQLFYFTGAPSLYIFVISILAFCSGIIFAGYFAWETLEFLNDAGMISAGFQSIKPAITSRNPRSIAYRNLPAIAFVLFLTVGTLYYTTNVAHAFADPYTCEVKGLVENPFTFTLNDFQGDEVTIEAELIGAYTHLPPANYTGILLSTILQHATVQTDAVGVQIIAKDGYSISLDITDVMTDSELLLTRTDDGLWLIAANYDGSMWVRQVILLQVY